MDWVVFFFVSNRRGIRDGNVEDRIGGSLLTRQFHEDLKKVV